MTKPQRWANALAVFALMLVGGIGLGSVIVGIHYSETPDGVIEIGPSPKYKATPKPIVMTTEHKATFPDCTDARAWPAGKFAAWVLVIEKDGTADRWPFDAAWDAAHDQDPTNDVWVIGMCGEPDETPRAVTPTSASEAEEAAAQEAYNPATDVWWSGYKTRTRTLCIEVHGRAAAWPWNAVVYGYRKAGMNVFHRPAGGCSALPADQKVIVRAYSRYDRKCAYTLAWRWNPRTGKHDGPLMQRAEIWLNLAPQARICRTGHTFASVAAHETGHVFGLAHTTYVKSIMHGDWIYPQWVDQRRLYGLYWKTPVR